MTPSPRHILVIDDDRPLTGELEEYLGKFGFRVLVAWEPRAGLAVLQERAIDLVILDLMLPGMDGIQVCRTIRATRDTPVIMLTARDDLADRIVGLEVGADDYLAKPFQPRELIARIEAILRRPRFIEKRREMRFGTLTIDTTSRRATLDGKVLDLTTMEFEILKLLAGHPGVVFTRDQIMDRLRGTEYSCYSRTIDVVLSRLRSKLGDEPRNPRFIKTVWGSGYTFLESMRDAA